MSPGVLHVTESLGGGVATALRSYVRATPELEHHLLAASRDEALASDYSFEEFSSVRRLPRSPVAAIRALRSAVAGTEPSVVHLHSSWAGLLGRVALVGRGVRIVYTPHGFAFERRDVPVVARCAFRTVERLLRVNTEVLAACSVREQALARALGHDVVIHVPNVAIDLPADLPQPRPAARVVTAGRLTPQKDPRYFAAVASPSAHRETEFWWIGGGDEAYLDELAAAQVRVTGWLSRADGLRELARGGVFLCTSAWEGFPLTILEAAEIGLPIVARRIPPLDYCPREWLRESPSELSELIDVLLDDQELQEKNVAAWRHALQDNVPERQKRALLAAYRGR